MFKIVNGIVTFVPTSLYVSAEGDQSGGGGGSGSSASLTEERVIALAAQQVSNQLLARTKDIEKRVGETVTKQLSEQFGSFTKSFEEKFAAIAPAAKGERAKGSEKGAEQSPEFATLKRQLDEQNALLKQVQQERDQERSARKTASMRQRVSDELAKHKIEGARARAAMAQLIADEQRVAYDDDGETIVFKDNTGSTLLLDEGVRMWASSSDAEIFKAPTGARGSGNPMTTGRQPPAGGGSKAPPSDEEAGLAMLNGFGLTTPG